MLRFLKLYLTICAAFAATARADVPSQACHWRTVEIGGGGFVTGTIFHPRERGLVYARTDVGGAYRLDPASGRWVALNDDIGGVHNEFQHLGVMSLALDPGDPDRVYLATGQYAGAESWKLPSRVYRSTDRGVSWQHVTPGFKMSGNGEGRGTGERMVVDPGNGANLFVGSNDTGIWRSRDHGASWTRVASFAADLHNLTFLAFAPATWSERNTPARGQPAISGSDPAVTLLPCADRVDADVFYLWNSAAKALHLSRDGGESFEPVATTELPAFHELRAVPGLRGHLWARAGNQGLYRSTAFGALFTRVPAVAAVHRFDFGKPKPGASHPTVFIWGTISGTNGLFRSDDEGSNWTRINDDKHQFGYLNDIAGDPRVYGRIFLGTSGRGVVVGSIPKAGR